MVTWTLAKQMPARMARVSGPVTVISPAVAPDPQPLPRALLCRVSIQSQGTLQQMSADSAGATAEESCLVGSHCRLAM